MLMASGVLPGCGGEDDEPASRSRPGGALARKAPTRSGEAPTKKEFVREANQICADAKRRIAPISDATAAKIDDEDALGAATELRKGLPIADEFLGQMRALTPPKGDVDIVAEYLDIVGKQKGRIRPLAEALEAEDISGIEVLAAELKQAPQTHLGVHSRGENAR